jgi:hypothetical protein
MHISILASATMKADMLYVFHHGHHQFHVIVFFYCLSTLVIMLIIQQEFFTNYTFTINRANLGICMPN